MAAGLGGIGEVFGLALSGRADAPPSYVQIRVGLFYFPEFGGLVIGVLETAHS